jgi:subtilisin-like proprotein convertase family protein
MGAILKIMKIKFIPFTGALVGLALALATAGPACAGVITESASYSPAIVIPDNDLNGVADTETFSSAIQSITDIQVGLNISGGYDGDFYAYLTHGSTDFAVLLNRIGVNSGSTYGSFDSGMNVTLTDTASANIHDATYNGGLLTGAYQPDGRNISPLTAPAALSATASTAVLGSFDGSDPNGAWTLFIADTSPVGIGTLESWSLDITGTSVNVPDFASTFALFLVSTGLLFVLNRPMDGGWRFGGRAQRIAL